jgi:hypothetical protein
MKCRFRRHKNFQNDLEYELEVVDTLAAIKMRIRKTSIYPICPNMLLVS